VLCDLDLLLSAITGPGTGMAFWKAFAENRINGKYTPKNPKTIKVTKIPKFSLLENMRRGQSLVVWG